MSEGDLAHLNDLSPDVLRAEWRRLYRSAPPRLSREMLMRAIGYRIQEKGHGGLEAAIKRKLAAYASDGKEEGAQAPPTPVAAVRPGARLIREWNGKTYHVTATEDGFDYDGATYRSLSQVARAITGARWSGPRFFGLLAKGAPKNAGSVQS